jgi:alginate O-acetyltransferase complex protein AlgI
MPFSSLIFIFWFLPIVFFINLVINKRYSNFFLAFASLFFYFWGESGYTVVFIFSILLNYIIGLSLDYTKKYTNNARKVVFILGIVANITLLGYFKYLNFIIDLINNNLGFLQLGNLNNPSIHLPIGISFFTFEAVAYLADVYTRRSKAMNNPVNLLLYMGIFPHLIAGPVIRYSDLEEQIKERKIDLENVAYGIKRFIIGLAKKVIIANNVGQIADQVFNNQATLQGANVFWIGVIAYSIQLYFDFSGYSDMAVGLGKMFGFTFIENFNYPYSARSVQDFWRKWNISLGIWFKNYVYIPMGGSKVSFNRNLFNLAVVFFLTGLWHGAGLNFIVWGLFSGFLIILEKIYLNKLLDNLPNIFGHLYLIFAILVSWVFFRSSDFVSSLQYLSKMLSLSYTDPSFLFNNLSLSAFGIGLILCFPIWRFITLRVIRTYLNSSSIAGLFTLIQHILLIGLFALSIGLITTNTYNPFIYFRF